MLQVLLVQYAHLTATTVEESATSAPIVPSPYLRPSRCWQLDVTAGNTGSQHSPCKAAGTVLGVGTWTEAAASLGNDDALRCCLQLSLGLRRGCAVVMCILHPAAAASSCAGGGLQSTQDASSTSQRAASDADMTMTAREGKAYRVRLLTSYNVKRHCRLPTQRWTVLRRRQPLRRQHEVDTQLVC